MRKANGQFAKGDHWRPHQAFRDLAYLQAEYVEAGRSAIDIASEWGVTEGAILYWLHKNQIRRRSMAEVRAAKSWALSGTANGMYGRTGAANPRYIDGSSPERQTMYSRSFWKVIAAQVLARDGYKCARCGGAWRKGNGLHAHHIKPWAGHPGDRFSIDNIITLCRKCHSWVHSAANTASEFIKS